MSERDTPVNRGFRSAVWADVLVVGAVLVFAGAWGCRKAAHSETAEAPAVAEETEGPASEHLSRAKECFESGDYQGAIAAYSSAIELKADLVEAYCGRALAYGHTGDDDRAIADFTEAIRLRPDDAEVFLSRGGMYENRGLYDLAIADYTKAIELKPDYAEAYSRRGIAYELKNEHDPAKSDLRKAIELDPDGKAGRSAKEFLGVLEAP